MGNFIRDKNDKICFTQRELDLLAKLFERIKNSDLETARKDQISENGMRQFFKENDQLGRALYSFMLANSVTKQGAHVVNLYNFTSCAELLMKEPAEYHNKSFTTKQFDKLELLTKIVLKRGDGKVDPGSIYLQQDEAEAVVNQVFQIFLSNSNDPDYVPEQGIRAFLNGLASPEDMGEVPLVSLSARAKSNFPMLNSTIRQYFRSKFLSEPQLRLPEVERPSHLLNKDFLTLLYLSNATIQKTPKLYLLYSTLSNGAALERVVYALRGYNAPTLILIRHTEKRRNGQQESFIFGGFNKKEWVDNASYSGDADNYIFSLSPVFRNYFTSKGNGENSFAYLNSQRNGNPKGLGFGGQNFANFRLWIDEDLENRSYTRGQDGTFEEGELIDPAIKQLKIDLIEIWGLGSSATLVEQQEFRHSEEETRETMRYSSRAAVNHQH
eukprot:TRINITY_DN518_c0_g1_i6.p1 TRINITY_DN518_c0_g1~~TRINITY_DN518_c0_g1_i6.p1  ORF type:complete len:440 (-),score=122.63 TRINITY_DN518_c0_g1_i6:164-1483(-)